MIMESVPVPPATVSVESKLALATVIESFPAPKVMLSAAVEDAVIVSAPDPVVTETAAVAPKLADSAPVKELPDIVTISVSKASVIVRSESPLMFKAVAPTPVV